MSTVSRIIDIVADLFSVYDNSVNEETHLEYDLGADELDVADLIITVEDDFDIKIPDSEAATIETVSDLVKLVDAQL